MSWGNPHRAGKAAAMLFLATAFWGASFILMKALGQRQQSLSPHAGSLLVSSLSLFIRFFLGAAVMLALNGRARRMTPGEIRQGIGLGLFGGLGILVQMDGVMYTTASTSAFVTQCNCVFIPIYIAVRRRELPARAIAAACVMVMAGVAVLSGFRFDTFGLGRGEAETVLASVFFTAQILWLERPVFTGNRSGPVTVTMFAVLAAFMLPVALLSGGPPREWITLYDSTGAIGIILFLTLGCTVTAYGLMNHWQPRVTSTHASLIYCFEPLFTSVFALFLPGLLSTWMRLGYANETITSRLVLGGGLITGANLLAMWQAARASKHIPVPPKSAEVSCAG